MRYLDLLKNKELQRRTQDALRNLKKCNLCPHACGVDRISGEAGFCRAGGKARIASYGPHFGEEPPLVGRGGSGTIFFSYCNLRCVFCQNYDISHLGEGDEYTAGQLSRVMLELQDRGCENINFVTPSHYVPQILEALTLAAGQGLTIPLVYNCGTYECLETLALLDGIIDIYLPHTKFSDPSRGKKYTGVKNYPDAMYTSLKEMHRQVGELQVNQHGAAERGLMVRHLVLPGELAGTTAILQFIAEELSVHTYINLMGQYYPAFKSKQYPELARRINHQELQDALQIAKELKLTRVIS